MLVRAVHSRFDTETDIEKARELSAATFILLGLNHSDAFIATLTKGIQKMRESSTYQMILREGREEGRIIGHNEGRSEGRSEGREEGRIVEARANLLLLGVRRFGALSGAQRERIETETSLPRLEVWLLSLLDAGSWAETLRSDVPL